MKIGITERGDAALDHNWKPWVESGKPAILITFSFLIKMALTGLFYVLFRIFTFGIGKTCEKKIKTKL